MTLEETIPVDEEGATLLRKPKTIGIMQQGLPLRQGFGVLVARRRQFMHQVRHDVRDSLHVRGAVRPRKTKQRSPPRRAGLSPLRLIPSPLARAACLNTRRS